MSAKKRLNSEQREFFSLVNRAAFSNPFSDERARLDSAISLLPAGENREARIRGVMEKVTAKIDLLDNGGPARLGDYTGKDAQILEYTFLFHEYHQYANEFDRLIERQFSNEEASEKVHFSEDFLSALQRRGFPPDRAHRYFEL